MTRDEFEDWLNDHMEEAISDVDDDSHDLGDWLRMTFRSLRMMAHDPVDEDDQIPEEPFEEEAEEA